MLKEESKMDAQNTPEMKEYRKTATIRAVQYLGQYVEGVCTGPHGSLSETVPHIHTLEGDLTVTAGDWIATGVKGEHWAIKPDVFEKSYVEVRAAPRVEEVPADHIGEMVPAGVAAVPAESTPEWEETHECVHGNDTTNGCDECEADVAPGPQEGVAAMPAESKPETCAHCGELLTLGREGWVHSAAVEPGTAFYCYAGDPINRWLRASPLPTASPEPKPAMPRATRCENCPFQSNCPACPYRRSEDDWKRIAGSIIDKVHMTAEDYVNEELVKQLKRYFAAAIPTQAEPKPAMPSDWPTYANCPHCQWLHDTEGWTKGDWVFCQGCHKSFCAHDLKSLEEPAPIPAAAMPTQKAADLDWREIAHALWYEGGRLRTNLSESVFLHPENWHVEAAKQRIAEWDKAVQRYFDFAIAPEACRPT